MTKTFIVARREFRTTVLSKAFLLGLLLPPVLMVLGIGISVFFGTDRAPAVKGSVAIIDRSAASTPTSHTPPTAEGLVIAGIRTRMTPEAISTAAARAAGESIKKAANEAAEAATKPPGADGGQAQLQAVKEIMGATSKAPDLTLETLPPTADAEAEKDKLRDWTADGGGRLYLAIIDRAVVDPAATAGQVGAGETYQVFTAPKLDPRVYSLVNEQVRAAVIEARLLQAGLDPARVEQLTNLPRARTTEVTKDGQRASTGGLQLLIPLAFFMLIWISAFSGAGQLLNNTIEEKSNRIMEVLLSAVSPFELMAGKIIGQLGAGLVIIAVYAGVGLVALVGLTLGDLVQPMQLVWLCVFYVLAYLFIASVFAAIGSAVSDIQEANSLMTPAMLLIMIPMFTVFPIIQNPKGMLAQVLSYIPPFSPFAMIARVGSNQPPAQWEIALSALVSAAGALGAIWVAAKIFRIGVLLYGKPPTFGTLLRWVRMA